MEVKMDVKLVRAFKKFFLPLLSILSLTKEYIEPSTTVTLPICQCFKVIDMDRDEQLSSSPTVL